MKSPHLIDFSLKIDDLFYYLCCLVNNKRGGGFWEIAALLVDWVNACDRYSRAGILGLPYCLPVQYLRLYCQIPHISVPLAALFYFCSPPYYLCVTHHTFIVYQLLYWKMCLSLNFVNRNLNLIMIWDMNFKF